MPHASLRQRDSAEDCYNLSVCISNRVHKDWAKQWFVDCSSLCRGGRQPLTTLCRRNLWSSRLRTTVFTRRLVDGLACGQRFADCCLSTWRLATVLFVNSALVSAACASDGLPFEICEHRLAIAEAFGQIYGQDSCLRLKTSCRRLLASLGFVDKLVDLLTIVRRVATGLRYIKMR